jgi:hypothetical protein
VAPQAVPLQTELPGAPAGAAALSPQADSNTITANPAGHR